MDIYNEFNPIFIIKHKENTNQHWRLYTNGSYKVLACIQDTYQYLHEKKMGWITAWLESPITEEERKEASIQISNSLYGIFHYIWGNKKWIGNSTDWIEDGTFHWYSHQWTTSIPIKNSYCILT